MHTSVVALRLKGTHATLSGYQQSMAAQMMADEALLAQQLVHIREQEGVVHRYRELHVPHMARAILVRQLTRDASASSSSTISSTTIRISNLHKSPHSRRESIGGAHGRVIETIRHRLLQIVECIRCGDALHTDLANLLIRVEPKGSSARSQQRASITDYRHGPGEKVGFQTCALACQ